MTTDNKKFELTQSQLDTLIATEVVPAGVPVAYLKLFVETAKRQKLDPFGKEIFLLGYHSRKKQKTTYSILTGIAAMRRKVGGQLAGQDDIKFNLKSDGKYQTTAELKAIKQLPQTATLTVYRVVGGVRCPFTKTLVFSEYNTGKQKWLTSPYTMIAKCCLAHCLRDGFGDLVGNMYTTDELGNIQDVDLDNSTKELAKQMNIDLDTDSAPVNIAKPIEADPYETIPLAQRKEIRALIEGCGTRLGMKDLYRNRRDWQQGNTAINAFVLAIMEQHASTLPVEEITVQNSLPAPTELF